MAHYAFLNDKNIVTEVIVGVDENELLDGLDPETWYGNFKGQVCKRTSYNTKANVHSLGGTPFRKNFASIGFYYDPIWDAFVPPKIFDSWVLNYDTFDWEPPIPRPEPGPDYGWQWGELRKDWVKVPLEPAKPE